MTDTKVTIILLCWYLGAPRSRSKAVVLNTPVRRGREVVEGKDSSCQVGGRGKGELWEKWADGVEWCEGDCPGQWKHESQKKIAELVGTLLPCFS